jgi:hypothetical protein
MVIGSMASKPSSNTEKVSSDGTKATAQPKVEKMTISKSNAKNKGYGIFEVVGEIANNDSIKHSATLKATFYAKDGSIMGTALGAVNDVEPSQTKTFNLMTTDSVTGYSEFKVQIDTLL